MTTSLVTGATGLLGNNLVRRLLERGERVRVLVRRGSDPRPLEGLDVQVRPGDVRDEAVVREAVRDVDRVFHAAARVRVGLRGLHQFRATNVRGTENVARAVQTAGVRMVHVSSVDALGWGTADHPADEDSPPGPDHGVPYVISKREAEATVLALVESGLDAVIVNPAYLLGPWDWKPSSGRMLLEVARGRALLAPPGGNDFCHVEAVAEGVVAAAERGRRGRRYILGGEALPYREAWALFAHVTGGRAPLGVAPAPLVQALGLLGDAAGAVVGREPDVNSGSARLAVRPHHFSSRRAVAELGYRPVGAARAAADAWEWFREHGYA